MLARNVNVLEQAAQLNAKASLQAVSSASNRLQASASAPRTSASTAPTGTNLVSVTMKQVVAIDKFDAGGPFGIGSSQADFYSVVEINGNKQESKTIDNRDNILPNWNFGQKVGTSQRYVPINISVFDEDRPYSADDQADINPLKGYRSLSLSYDTQQGKVIGGAGFSGQIFQRGSDITVRGAGDGNRAEVRFSVNHQYVAPQRTVRLTVDQVSAIDRLDGGVGTVGSSQADFYAKVTMAGVTQVSKTIADRDYVQPNWKFDRVAGSNRYVPIEINLFDEDRPYSADDHADINPLSKNRTLNLSYDLQTGKISGNGLSRVYSKGEQIVVRGAGDSDRAEIRFRITDLMV